MNVTPRFAAAGSKRKLDGVDSVRKIDLLCGVNEVKKIASDLYPKQRTGKECKKTDCDRYESYTSWQCGTGSLNFCMNCKNAHVSQFKKKKNT